MSAFILVRDYFAPAAPMHSLSSEGRLNSEREQIQFRLFIRHGCFNNSSLLDCQRAIWLLIMSSHPANVCKGYLLLRRYIAAADSSLLLKTLNCRGAAVPALLTLLTHSTEGEHLQRHRRSVIPWL